jgi:para-nitrobenzyl esterase
MTMKSKTILTASLIIFLFVVVIFIQHEVSNEPLEVESGLITGNIEDGIFIYRGIPYAAPPVGELRWRAPQPPPKWSGLRSADKFGPTSLQSNKANETSEDCLYLNIWTPTGSAEERLPVMMWIHGGAFVGGSTAQKLYRGKHLAKKGVVLVTIGYRLGVSGYLAHPSLSAENERHVSGNYGLLDIIAALKWVQRNISAFGGDPECVTIFGESAGGIAVSMLCASPLAKGLFHRAISQSGGSFGPIRTGGEPGENVHSLKNAEQAGKAWALKVGACSAAELRQLPPDILKTAGIVQGVTWPVMDGWVIPDDQYKLYEAGKYNDTPVLVGYNSEEGTAFLKIGSPTEDYLKMVHERYGKFAKKLLALYPPAGEKVDETQPDLLRDTAFGWHNWTWVRLQSKAGGSKAFLYYFDHHDRHLLPANAPINRAGSFHGDEIPFVFHQSSDSPYGFQWANAKAEDHAMSEMIMSYWTNFAKYGDPNGKGLPKWPAYSDKDPQVMHFLWNKANTGPVVQEEGLKTLDEYFKWRRNETQENQDNKTAVTTKTDD